MAEPESVTPFAQRRQPPPATGWRGTTAARPGRSPLCRDDRPGGEHRAIGRCDRSIDPRGDGDGQGLGGQLKLRWRQSPVVLNPHLIQGQQDTDASRPVYEPLTTIAGDGNDVPILAAAIPLVARKNVSGPLKGLRVGP